MAVRTSVTYGPEAESRLGQLGLSLQDIYVTVRTAYQAAAGCTKNDPRSLPGTLAWGKGTGQFRDRMKDRGWRADSAMNFETTIHPSNSHAVALAAGDSGTGLSDGLPPRTRRPKGPATRIAVGKNYKQLQLGRGTNVFALIGRDTDDEDRVTWLLLHYHDADASEVRVEVSCPLEMSGSHIVAWRERIVLSPLPFGAKLPLPIDEDEPIDIDVQRKGSADAHEEN